MPKLFFHPPKMLVLHFQTSGYGRKTISDDSILGQKLLSDTLILLLKPKIAWFCFKTMWGTFSKKIAFSWRVDAKSFLSTVKYVSFTYGSQSGSFRKIIEKIHYFKSYGLNILLPELKIYKAITSFARWICYIYLAH